VILETSGLADPVLLLDVLTSAELLPRVRVAQITCVADAARWNELASLGPLLRRQLALADTILLNKADLVSPSALQAVDMKIRALNPQAVVLPSMRCDVTLPSPDDVNPRKREACNPEVGGAAHPHAYTATVPVPHPIERGALEASLSHLPPQVWRAKGFVRLRGDSGLQLLQYTGGETGRWHFAPFHVLAGRDEPPAVIVFIGAGLDEEALQRDFGSSRLAAFW
jgi:G3E family GTPase